MGLDTTVMCDCYVSGVISKPLFAEHIILDSEGYLELDLPFSEHRQLHNQFVKWVRSACAHENMVYASEHIANWTGYRSFQQTLGDIGWQNFPILRQELPNTNGGLTSVEQATQILKELQSFRQQHNLGKRYVLVDAATNEEIHEYIVAYSGRFILDGVENLALGIDTGGFFIQECPQMSEAIHEVFRSINFEQILLEPELTENQERGRVKYVDALSGLEFECASAVSGKVIPWPSGDMQNDKGQFWFTYPRKMYTEWRERKPSDYTYLIEALGRICKAAIEIGNPIRWG